MRKNLLLSGSIGCGKSTLIRQALGKSALSAGGFVTLRVIREDALLGFNLAPAAALAEDSCPRQRFLDFTEGKRRNDAVFSDFGAEILRDSLRAPFAVADEFGGLELMIPEFCSALMALLQSEVPVVGVFKTPEASVALIRRLHPESSYEEAYRKLRRLLLEDPNTQLLETTGRGDIYAEQQLRLWVNTYVRK